MSLKLESSKVLVGNDWDLKIAQVMLEKFFQTNMDPRPAVTSLTPDGLTSGLAIDEKEVERINGLIKDYKKQVVKVKCSCCRDKHLEKDCPKLREEELLSKSIRESVNFKRLYSEVGETYCMCSFSPAVVCMFCQRACCIEAVPGDLMWTSMTCSACKGLV